MNTKIFIAALIMAIVLSLLAFVLNFASLFPAPVAYFSIALISGCLTTFWVIRPQAEEKPSRRKKKKSHGPKETGSVKWFSPSKGYGFVTRENGEDIFVHFRSIEGRGNRILQQGQKVEFAVTQGDKGLQAEDVSQVN